MINTIVITVLCVLIILNLKWILFAIILPFQIIDIKSREIKQLTGKRVSWLRLLSAPYLMWEKYIMRGGWSRYMIFQVGMVPSVHFRKLIYKLLGAQIGHDVVFHFKTEVRAPERLVIGGGSIIGDNAILDARGGLELGKNVNISSNVSIYTLQHDHRDPDFKCTNFNAKVTIGDRVWLGSNCIILPGVTIGEGAVCCAGCVVTKGVEPYTVVAGIPAKKVNERPRNLRYNFRSKNSCRLY